MTGFDDTYQRLPPAVRRFYRQLADLPAAPFGRDTVHFLDIPPEDDPQPDAPVNGPDVGTLASGVQQTQEKRPVAGLEALVDAGLLKDLGAGRWVLDGPQRGHAARMAELTDGPVRRRARQCRAVDFYLTTAAVAGHLLMPNRPAYGPSGSGRAPGRGAVAVFDGPEAAVEWLERELGGVVAAQRLAADLDDHGTVIAACDAAYPGCVRLRRYREWVAMHELGVISAEKVGDAAGLARIRTQLAEALTAIGRTPAARTHAERAVRSARTAGSLLLEAAAHAGLGAIAHARGDYASALASWRYARSLYECAGGPDSVLVDMDRRIGVTWRDSGNPSTGETCLRQAIRDAHGLGDEWLLARATADLGVALTATGRPQAALDLLDEARAGMRALAALADVAAIEQATGDAHVRLGAHVTARARYAHAWAGFTALDDQRAAATVEDRLICLPSPPRADSTAVASRAHALLAAFTPVVGEVVTRPIRGEIDAGEWLTGLGRLITAVRRSGTPLTPVQDEALIELLTNAGMPITDLDILHRAPTRQERVSSADLRARS